MARNCPAPSEERPSPSLVPAAPPAAPEVVEDATTRLALAAALEQAARELRAGSVRPAEGARVNPRLSLGIDDFASLMRRVEAEAYDPA